MSENGKNWVDDPFAPRLVDINHLQCALAAEVVPELVRRREVTDPFSLKDKSRTEQATALFYLVGICNRLNWDFVLGQFAKELWEITEGFSPDTLDSIDRSLFRKAFGTYRRDDGGLNYSSRLENLKAIGRHVRTHDSVRNVLASNAISGDSGAASLIRQAPVYNDDPLLKKCNALLHELVRRNLIQVIDADEISPAIDYHIMRLYLRTGRVRIADEDLRNRLVRRKRIRIEVITEIRKAVSDALKYTAWLANISVSTLNDIEWAFARQACRRDHTWCRDTSKKCPLDHFCLSAFQLEREMVAEPDSRHGHY
jgi:hypothetical protein